MFRNRKQVRIWAWDNPDHQLKIEVFGLGGAVKDLAWGPESKRIVCCGAGSGMNARAFMWDTGSNLGEVVGHSKRVISCDYRQVRPYRVMTGSEDHRTIFYQGPPFKMDHSNNNQHTNFVNCVRFSPDGSKIATCSSDKKVTRAPYRAWRRIAIHEASPQGDHYVSAGWGLCGVECSVQVDSKVLRFLACPMCERALDPTQQE